MQISKFFAFFYINLLCIFSMQSIYGEGLPLYYWKDGKFTNFGDFLSLKLIERIIDGPVGVRFYRKNRFPSDIKLLGIGSIIAAACDGDIVWGSGINGKSLDKKKYQFNDLDVRAVRGPLTRDFLIKNFQIDCPEVYGDPALLFPYFFPEFKKKEQPEYDYLIIPHYSEQKLFPKELFGENVVYPTEPWDIVITKILNSRLVIAGSLHGVIVAEAFGIPAICLKATMNEPIFKYMDYYLGTQRPDFKYATSLEEALNMEAQPPYICDLNKLYQAFPFEFWPNHEFKQTLEEYNEEKI